MEGNSVVSKQVKILLETLVVVVPIVLAYWVGRYSVQISDSIGQVVRQTTDAQLGAPEACRRIDRDTVSVSCQDLYDQTCP